KYTHVGTFAGTPNNGNVTVPVGFTNLQGGAAVNQNGHYISVGNPYASPISVAEFFLANSDVLEAGNGLYFWRKKNNAAANSYAHLTMMAYTANNALGGGDVGNNADYYLSPVGTAFNADWIISPGQGFLVKLKATLNTTDAVKFTNSMRRAAPATGGQPFFRTLNTNDEAPLSRLWINLSGAADAFSQAAIGYMEGATLDLDYGYDGRILGDGTAKLYSKAAASNLAIQARPAFTATDVVPMGFAVTAPGQYTLSLDHMDGLFSDSQEVYLKDNLTGTTTNIKQNGYSFITEAGTFDGRFEVVYMQGQLGTQTPDLTNMVMVYQQNGAIMINSGTAEMTGVTLYDIRGRKLYQRDNINATEASVSGLNIANQVVIVEISTVNSKVSKKIIY
ncbi:MAG: T9SS type A sorting domain-containing protein, partial [Sphingobacteriales bacterium]